MTKLTLYVPRLTASRDDRTLTGLLLPYNEVGRTNLGRLTASAASQLDVADTVVLNAEHDPQRPIGKLTSLTPTPAGLQAAFAVAKTRDGDDALLEAAEGLRAGLSIEIEPIVTRGGQIISGTIAGAALVSQAAFPSARLAASDDPEVPDLGDLPDELAAAVALVQAAGYTVIERQPDVDTPDASTDNPNEDPTEDPNKEEEPKMTAARVQNRALLGTATKTPAPIGKNKLFAALAEYTNTRLEAALSDIVPANTPGVGINQPAYVGELWDGVEYERKFLTAFAHAELTSYNVKGWKWNNKPVVAKYTGNKADVSSNPILIAEVDGVLQRFAGAHDIDRIYTDFGDQEFWAAYFAAMAESYAKETDLYIRDIVKAVPTAGNGQRVHLLNAQMPAGVPVALAQIVKGAVKMLTDLNTLPTHAYVVASQWEPILYTPMTDVLTYLNAAIGIKGGTLEGQGEGFRIIPVPDGSLTATGPGFVGTTMVCHRNALSVRELGGGAPIRVNALDVAKGGVDEALFGYVGTLVEEPKGIILYDAPTAS